MEVFNKILDILNYFVMFLLTIGFLPQLIYVCLFWLKPKKYPKSEIKHNFAVLVAAHNEESVINGIIKCVLMQDYPQDKISFFLVADNCTDNTANVARELGVTVFERFDELHKSKGYALQYGVNQILDNYPKDTFDAFLFFDADGILARDYVDKMNDALSSGEVLARAYTNSTNLTQNMSTCAWGLYYIRDCRFSCNARSAMRTANMMPGPCHMVKTDLLIERGYDAFGKCEDAEFTINRLLEGHKAAYVVDAGMFDEQASTFSDTFNRNTRMGAGLNKIFLKDGYKLLGKFFTTFRWSYLDMFLQLLFIPLAIICCFWFPLYYGYQTVLAAMDYAVNPQLLNNILKMCAISLSCIFYLPFVLQTLLVIALDKNRLIYDKLSTLIKASFIFPFFMIVYMAGITVGCINPNTKWKSIRRLGSQEERTELLIRLYKDKFTQSEFFLNGEKEQAEETASVTCE